MINWKLLKCAFNRHEYSKMLHRDLTDRWIKICRNCGNTIAVEAPKDENGDPMDPSTPQAFDIECLKCEKMVCEDKIEFERRG